MELSAEVRENADNLQRSRIWRFVCLTVLLGTALIGAGSSIAALPPRQRVPLPVGPHHRVELHAEGDGIFGFSLFVTLGVTLAVSHFTGRWLAGVVPARRAGFAGGLSGAVIGLLAALPLLGLLGLPFRLELQTAFPIGMCLLFGTSFGRRAALEHRTISLQHTTSPET